MKLPEVPTSPTLYKNEWLWAAVLALLMVALSLVSGFAGLYGQDGYEYWRFANELKLYATTGAEPVPFFWPENYPVLGSLLSLPFQDSAFPLQLISILSHCLTFVIVVKLIRRSFPDARFAIAYSFLFICLSPYLLRSGMLVMADSLAMVSLLASFYFAVRYRQEGNHFFCMLAAALAFFSAFTRYAAAAPAIVPLLICLITWIKKPSVPAAFLSLVGIAIAVLPHFLLASGQQTDFLGHAWLSNWSPLNLFAHHFTTPDGYEEYLLPNLLHTLSPFLHPGFFVPGIFLLLFFRRSDFKNPILILSFVTVIIYAIFLAGIPYQNIRFLVLTFPFIALMMFPAFIRMTEKGKGIKIPAFVMIMTVVFIQLSLTAYVSRKIVTQWKLEKEVTEEMKRHENKTLHSFSFEGVFHYYGVKNKVVSTFKEKVSECLAGSLLLVQPHVAETQWKGMNPGLNWEFFKTNCKLIELKKFREGWVLYEIQ